MPLTPHGSDPGNWDGTHIGFRIHVPTEEHSTRKTHIWLVQAKRDGYLLGTVKWFGQWRKYSFFPSPECVFENVCLHEIAQFIEDRMQERKTGI